MARYIDADALREPLSTIIENAEANGLYNMAHIYERCLEMIENAPTADVAPRAEVEMLKEKYEIVYQPKAMIEANAKAEVAREIFEEIEKYMMDSVDVTHTAYKTIGTSTFAILKKKYTEVQK